MVSYRFLRPDDLPLIAEAVVACFNVHFPGAGPMNLEVLKTEAREINLWASSCMIALEGDRPVGILVGAKRSGRTNILRVGVVADQQGRGHGTHLLQSLSSKLAIVGPPAIFAELPAGRPDLARFFAGCGFEAGPELVDFRLDQPLLPLPPTEAVVAAPVAQLLADEALWARAPAAWVRENGTLTNRKEHLGALAVAAPESILACLVWWYRPGDGAVEILRFAHRDAATGPALQRLLLRRLSSQVETALHIPRLHEAEMPFGLLEAMGFRPGERHIRYRAEARAF